MTDLWPFLYYCDLLFFEEAAGFGALKAAPEEESESETERWMSFGRRPRRSNHRCDSRRNENEYDREFVMNR